MDKQYNTSEQINFNKWMKYTRDYWIEDARKLVKHLFAIGYTYDKIGKILKVSRQAAEQKYPNQGGDIS